MPCHGAYFRQCRDSPVQCKDRRGLHFVGCQDLSNERKKQGSKPSKPGIGQTYRIHREIPCGTIATTGLCYGRIGKEHAFGYRSEERHPVIPFVEHNEEYAQKVGVNRTEETYSHYVVVYNHVRQFLQTRHHMEDIALKQLTHSFIEQFDFYLRTEKRHSANTIGGYTILLKKIIRRAINQGTLLRDPFADYRPEQPPKNADT